jgi:hypothetical protein
MRGLAYPLDLQRAGLVQVQVQVQELGQVQVQELGLVQGQEWLAWPLE